MLITHAPSLAELTTLCVGGKAVALVRLESERDMDALPATLEKLGGRPVVLGRGSNILAHDGKLPVCLVHPALNDEPHAVGELASEGKGQPVRVLVRVGAGVGLQRLLGWCARAGLGGLEGMTGIPGHVGGAVAMNAGSYDCEIGQYLHGVDAFSPCAGLRWYNREEVEAAYRHFTIPAVSTWFVMCSVVLALSSSMPPGGAALRLREAMRLTAVRKKATQPVQAASAGCIFKNPEGLSAGRLLDEAGCKGMAKGGMAFSTLHANFLVNNGGGTATEALALIHTAREQVRARCGVNLDLEVRELAC